MAVAALLLNSNSVEGAKLKQKNGYLMDDTSLVQINKNHDYYKKARAEELYAQEQSFVNDIYEPDIKAVQAFNEVDNMVNDFTSQQNDESMVDID